MKYFAVLLSIFWATQALACADDENAQEMIAETATPLRAYANLAPGALSQPFDMQLRFCGDNIDAIERVEVEAIMPAHQHGMNYTPIVKALGPGRFSVSGMVFHMPGTWQVRLAVFGDVEPMFFSLEVVAR